MASSEYGYINVVDDVAASLKCLFRLLLHLFVMSLCAELPWESVGVFAIGFA